MTLKKYAIYCYLVVLALSGCATAQQPDPIEAINRKTFALNQQLDKAILQPVARRYQQHVPLPVRTSLTHFYANPRDLLSAISLFMQQRLNEGVSDLMRVGINTTLGLLGLFDVATPLGFEKHQEEIGQALAYWGMDAGAYIVWPLLGPSTTRDTVSLVSNLMVSPQTFIADNGLYYGLTALQLVNTRSTLLQASDLLDESALDPYLAVRDAYLQQRKPKSPQGQLPPSAQESTEFDSEDP